VLSRSAVRSADGGGSRSLDGGSTVWNHRPVQLFLRVLPLQRVAGLSAPMVQSRTVCDGFTCFRRLMRRFFSVMFTFSPVILFSLYTRSAS